MSEREKGKEIIGRGELFFLGHRGKEVIFSGYGLTLEEGRKGNLVGLLMVDRPRPANPTWLRRVKKTFGKYQLVPMTSTGERGIVCRMEVEQKDQRYLQQYSMIKTGAIRKALEPLLENPPKPAFRLYWDEEIGLWKSQILSTNEPPS